MSNLQTEWEKHIKKERLKGLFSEETPYTDETETFLSQFSIKGLQSKDGNDCYFIGTFQNNLHHFYLIRSGLYVFNESGKFSVVFYDYFDVPKTPYAFLQKALYTFFFNQQ